MENWPLSRLIVPAAISNVVALGLVAVAARAPRAARYIIGAGFILAGIFNTYTALRTPGVYVDAYGPLAIWPYNRFIYGPFARHTAIFVIAIATGQCASGLLALLPGRLRRLGLAGAIVFLLAIAGLGWGSAFPATPIMAAAVWLVYRATPL
jgi:hypothetical protein